MIKQERIFFNVRSATWFSIAVYVLLIGGLIGTRFYMQQNLGNLDNEIKKEQVIISKQDNVVLKNSISADNAAVQDYNNLAVLNPNWSKVLEKFVSLVPPGVEVQDFKGNTESGEIDITGTALSRDAVLQLRDNILNDPMFKDINLPLDNLQQPANLSWHYAFFVKTNLLQANPDAKIKLPPPLQPPPSATTPQP